MATADRPEVTLYDLACTKDVCFSANVWPIRMMLNHKKISYRTVFLEFPDIKPALETLGVALPKPTDGMEARYTVPAIFHAPTDTHIMDSAAIAEFLQSKYPDPPVDLTSPLAREVKDKTFPALGPTLVLSMLQPEMNILIPQSQDYFRNMIHERLGFPMENLGGSEADDKRWEEGMPGIRELGALLQTHKDEGPFILGARPSYADLYITGLMQFARVIDEGKFERLCKESGYREIYEACEPYLEKKT